MSTEHHSQLELNEVFDQPPGESAARSSAAERSGAPAALKTSTLSGGPAGYTTHAGRLTPFTRLSQALRAHTQCGVLFPQHIFSRCAFFVLRALLTDSMPVIAVSAAAVTSYATAACV